MEFAPRPTHEPHSGFLFLLAHDRPAHRREDPREALRAFVLCPAPAPGLSHSAGTRLSSEDSPRPACPRSQAPFPFTVYCSAQQPSPAAAAGRHRSAEPTPEPGRPPRAPPGASPGCATRPPAPCGSPAAPASRAGTCPPRGSWLVDFPGLTLESPARALCTQRPPQFFRTTQIS